MNQNQKNLVSLRIPQKRILKALAKAGRPMTRSELAKKAPVDLAMCTGYIGSSNDDIRKANDQKRFPSLISLGLVRFSNNEDNGAALYELSKKGEIIVSSL